MGEEAGFMLDEGNEAETETPQKAYRHRKKQLYQSIRKQMEFYFSDSNLTKDRFLGNLLKQDPCVDLSIFIRFNRIRALTTDITDIAKALRHSELLSVTEDGTKVFRTKPVQQKDNIDECTIYVEQLPPDADHDWLRDVFSAYGNVAYVSIPKYRTSGKIKGFAFVEFETPEEANKTLEAFGARGCRLSSEIAPDKLCSIATFEAEETSNVDETNPVECSEKEDKQQSAEKDFSPHKRKRRSSHKESIKDIDNERVMEKEAKSTENRGQILSEEDIQESIKESEDDREENNDLVKRKRAKSQEKVKFVKKEENEKQEDSSSNIKRKRKKTSEEEIEDEEIDPDTSKKRRKLHDEQDTQDVKAEESTKKKKKKNQEVYTSEDQEGEDNIVSKGIKAEVIESEDLAPENIHVDQPVKKKRKRENEEETRENATEEDEQVLESGGQYFAEGEDVENVEVESKRKRKRKKKKKNKQDKQDINASSLQILSKKEWKRLRNKYLDMQRAKMKCLKQYLSRQRWSNQMQQYNADSAEPEVKVSQPRISFTPGVIVCAVLDEPIMDIRKFKADTKALQNVEYVDVMQGANVAYIRCSTAEGAKQLASSNPWVSSKVLGGEEETEYWDKIMTDRKVKFSNKIRTKQRGRDKVLRRAERELGKHIKFDE